MFEKVETGIPGCFLLRPRAFRDVRGTFVKHFHAPSFAALGLENAFVEDFFSISGRGVVRGFHFQSPPHDHAKLVVCLSGSVRDAVVDLRPGSPALGKAISIDLNGDDPVALYVPRGAGHAFQATSDGALVLYKTTTVHSPEHDPGVRWDSCGVEWALIEPLVSNRDLAFPTLGEYLGTQTSGSYTPR